MVIVDFNKRYSARSSEFKKYNPGGDYFNNVSSDDIFRRLNRLRITNSLKSYCKNSFNKFKNTNWIWRVNTQPVCTVCSKPCCPDITLTQRFPDAFVIKSSSTPQTQVEPKVPIYPQQSPSAPEPVREEKVKDRKAPQPAIPLKAEQPEKPEKSAQPEVLVAPVKEKKNSKNEEPLKSTPQADTAYPPAPVIVPVPLIAPAPEAYYMTTVDPMDKKEQKKREKERKKEIDRRNKLMMQAAKKANNFFIYGPPPPIPPPGNCCFGNDGKYGNGMCCRKKNCPCQDTTELWNKQFNRWWGWNYGRHREGEGPQDYWMDEYDPCCEDNVSPFCCDDEDEPKEKESILQKLCCSCCRGGCDWGCYIRPSVRDDELAKQIEVTTVQKCPRQGVCKTAQTPYDLPQEAPAMCCNTNNRNNRFQQQSWMREQSSSSICSCATNKMGKQSTTKSSIEFLSCKIQSVSNDLGGDDCCCCCTCNIPVAAADCQTEQVGKCKCLQTDVTVSPAAPKKRKCCKCCKNKCKRCLRNCPDKKCNGSSYDDDDDPCKPDCKRDQDKHDHNGGGKACTDNTCEKKIKKNNEKNNCRGNSTISFQDAENDPPKSCKKRGGNNLTSCSWDEDTKHKLYDRRPPQQQRRNVRTTIYRVTSTQHANANQDVSTGTRPFMHDVDVCRLKSLKTSPLFLNPIFNSPLSGRRYQLTPRTVQSPVTPPLAPKGNYPSPLSVSESIPEVKSGRGARLISAVCDSIIGDLKCKREKNYNSETSSMEELLDIRPGDSGFISSNTNRGFEYQVGAYAKFPSLVTTYSLDDLGRMLKELKNTKDNKNVSSAHILAKAEAAETKLMKASKIVKDVLEQYKSECTGAMADPFTSMCDLKVPSCHFLAAQTTIKLPSDVSRRYNNNMNDRKDSCLKLNSDHNMQHFDINGFLRSGKLSSKGISGGQQTVGANSQASQVHSSSTARTTGVGTKDGSAVAHTPSPNLDLSTYSNIEEILKKCQTAGKALVEDKTIEKSNKQDNYLYSPSCSTSPKECNTRTDSAFGVRKSSDSKGINTSTSRAMNTSDSNIFLQKSEINILDKVSLTLVDTCPSSASQEEDHTISKTVLSTMPSSRASIVDQNTNNISCTSSVILSNSSFLSEEEDDVTPLPNRDDIERRRSNSKLRRGINFKTRFNDKWNAPAT